MGESRAVAGTPGGVPFLPVIDGPSEDFAENDQLGQRSWTSRSITAKPAALVAGKVIGEGSSLWAAEGRPACSFQLRRYVGPSSEVVLQPVGRPAAVLAQFPARCLNFAASRSFATALDRSPNAARDRFHHFDRDRNGRRASTGCGRVRCWAGRASGGRREPACPATGRTSAGRDWARCDWAGRDWAGGCWPARPSAARRRKSPISSSKAAGRGCRPAAATCCLSSATSRRAARSAASFCSRCLPRSG